MTDRKIELTRRKILGAAGAVGVAGAGAGVGTSALFSETDDSRPTLVLPSVSGSAGDP